MSQEPVSDLRTRLAVAAAIWTLPRLDSIQAIANLIRERELAIAHDTQPYPTADAYERVCAAYEKLRLRVTQAIAILEHSSDHHANARLTLLATSEPK